MSREEFGLQAEGENRRMELLRRGLSGFMAALKTRGTALGMARSPSIPVSCAFLACYLLHFCHFFRKQDLYILC